MIELEEKNIEREEIIRKLANASLDWSLGALIGAGFSKSITNNKALNWKELFEEVIRVLRVGYEMDIFDEDYLNGRLLNGYTLPQIASEICKELWKSSKNELTDFEEAKNFLKSIIRAITAWVPEEETCENYAPVLEALNLDWVITTNYDEIMESLLKDKCYSLSPNDPFLVPKKLLPVYHIHGSRLDPNDLVVAEDDYIKLFRPDKYSQSKLASLTGESTILVLGYGLSDLNILAAIDKGNNVYQMRGRCQQENITKNEVIQAIYVKEKKIENLTAYVDTAKGATVIEINDIFQFLEEIKVEKERLEQEKKGKVQKWDVFQAKFKEANEYFQQNFSKLETDDACFAEFIEKNKLFSEFINKDDKRCEILQEVVEFINYFNHTVNMKEINQFISHVLEIEKENTNPNNHFEEYKILLATILDILFYMPRNYMDPIWFEHLISYLGYVLGYTENTMGNSFAASDYWNEKKSILKKEHSDVWEELLTMAKVNDSRTRHNRRVSYNNILVRFMEE